LGKTTGQGLLYADWKCFENSSVTSLGWIDLKLDEIRISFPKGGHVFPELLGLRL
jgi:hypothetical protein